jgi:phosphatidylglycerophosphate synthase
LFEDRLFLPDLNPSYYHLLGLALSVLYLYARAPGPKIFLIVVVLLADWFDGATARRYHRVRRAGYITDVVTDRASEAFLFVAEAGTALGQIFFLLWMVNALLTFYSVYSNKHTSLPLRFAYIVVLMAQAWGIGN